MRAVRYISVAIGVLLILGGCSEDIPGLGQPVSQRQPGRLPPPVNLKWSPTGEWIVFLELGQIQMMRTDGSGEREILSGQGGYDHPVWSPDGKRLAYDHAPRMAAPDVWVSEPLSNRAPIRLTEDVRSDEFPCWSPDGTRIAFQTFRRGNRDIWIVDANGYREPVPLTTHPAHDELPAWSPDGAQIAFVSNRGGTKNIWIQPVDGDDSTAWQLTHNPEGDTLPIWSPDGSQIAYLSKRSGQWYLWVTDAVPGAGNGHPVSVTTGIRAPNWSPDGKFLIFESKKTGWMVRADGQGRQIEIVQGLEPVWSPDGSRIAYVVQKEDRYQIQFKEQTTDLDW